MLCTDKIQVKHIKYMKLFSGQKWRFTSNECWKSVKIRGVKCWKSVKIITGSEKPTMFCYYIVIIIVFLIILYVTIIIVFIVIIYFFK